MEGNSAEGLPQVHSTANVQSSGETQTTNTEANNGVRQDDIFAARNNYTRRPVSYNNRNYSTWRPYYTPSYYYRPGYYYARNYSVGSRPGNFSAHNNYTRRPAYYPARNSYTSMPYSFPAQNNNIRSSTNSFGQNFTQYTNYFGQNNHYLAQPTYSPAQNSNFVQSDVSFAQNYNNSAQAFISAQNNNIGSFYSSWGYVPQQHPVFPVAYAIQPQVTYLLVNC